MIFTIFCFASLIAGIFAQNGENCVAQTEAYLKCLIDAEKAKGIWSFRRSYNDHDAADRCFQNNGCTTSPNYDRLLFSDFIKLWQDASNKTWTEFVNTPEHVKNCMRQVVRAVSRDRLDQCGSSLGSVGTLPNGYSDDLELPLCVQETPDSWQTNQMTIGLTEKIAILYQLNECKATNGIGAAQQTIVCLESARKNTAKQNLCLLANQCESEKVSETCRQTRKQLITNACRCAAHYRDSILQKIEIMYQSGSLEVLKLSPAFLGLDLTLPINSRLKKCYSDAGLLPITMLTALDNPFLNLLKGFKPQPQGMQGIRNLVYAQLDLPDFCDSCP